MPNPVRIQPIEFSVPPEPPEKAEPVGKPILFKSRFKRIFERQFTGVLRTPSTDKLVCIPEPLQKDGLEELEPSSVCLARMVQNFMEESNEKSQQRCGRNRCNCFNGYRAQSSDEEMDDYISSAIDVCDLLKRLVVCLFVSERNLLADTAKVVDRNLISKREDGFCRKIVADDLIALGYDAAVCISKWEKSPSFPAGEYEYVDVLIDGERLIIDIDFRSEFEIARSTKAYKQVLQTLPLIFVGKSDRLEKIISIVSEAAEQSLRKKGMPCPPWRRAGYVKAKWLSPFTRIGGPVAPISLTPPNNDFGKTSQKTEASIGKRSTYGNDFEFHLGEGCSTVEQLRRGGFVSTDSNNNSTTGKKGQTQLVKPWEPPEIKPKNLTKGVKIVTGLASVIQEDKP